MMVKITCGIGKFTRIAMNRYNVFDTELFLFSTLPSPQAVREAGVSRHNGRPIEGLLRVPLYHRSDVFTL